MHGLVPNDNSIYNVSTKRVKHNLDSTYLWHCCLAHISKKRIEKLQQEGLLKSIYDELFDQCISCLSGKMTRKSFPHRPERATDLPGIIHTDVCGPLRHVSRQGASYFITFTDDNSRYGYVYLLKHKHEVFETFKDYALESVTRILNMVPTKKVDKIPYELCEIPMEVEGFEPPQEEVISVHRFERTHQAPTRLCLNVEAEKHSLGDFNEPTSYKATMLDSESKKWIDAMNVEIQSMIDNMVWVLVDLLPGCKTVRSKWIFKKKTEMDAMFYDYEISQIDVKTAFLKVYVDEDMHMVQLEGFVDPNHPIKVCKLQRSIYGFKQASRSWNKRFDEEIKSLQSVNDYLGKCFAMKDLGEAAFILGIIIYRDSSKQSTTAMSATKAECIAASEATMEAVWIRKFILGLGIVPTINEAIRMFCDNSASRHFANESGVQRGIRHYHRRYHYVRESIALGEIRFLKVYVGDNLADPFTKALSNTKLTQHARSMGLRLASSFMYICVLVFG
nr:hypothetical protein [Tanacetum cinerariifolium]